MVGVDTKARKDRHPKSFPNKADVKAKGYDVNLAIKSKGKAFAIHHVHGLDQVPQSITALSARADEDMIAVTRASGQIEVWSNCGQLFCDLVLQPAHLPAALITQCVWVNGRLLSCALDGKITQWDLARRSPGQVTDSYGGAVFAMCYDLKSGVIAAACADGSARLFEMTPSGDVSYCRALMRAGVKGDCRAISLCFHPTEHRLAVAHSDGIIRVFNLETGNVVGQLRTDSAAESRAMCFTSDGSVLVTGDSVGRTQFWCSVTWTMLQSLSHHIADIRAIALHDQTVFVTGTDETIVGYQCVEGTWVKIVQSRHARSDLVAMISLLPNHDTILAAGLDGQLHCWSSPSTASKAPRVTSPPTGLPLFTTSVDHSRTHYAVKNKEAIELWKMQQSGPEMQFEASIVQAVRVGSGTILAFKLSPSATTLVVSTASRLSVIDLVPTPIKRRTLHALPPCSALAFSKDGSVLHCLSLESELFSICMTSLQVLQQKDLMLILGECPLVSHLEMSPDGDLVGLVTLDRRVHLIDTSAYTLRVTLPRFEASVTAIGFDGTTVACALSTNALHIFDYSLRSFTAWSTANARTALARAVSSHSAPSPSSRLLGSGSPIFRIEFNPSIKSQIVLVAANFLCKIDMAINAVMSLTQHRAAASPTAMSTYRVIRHSPSVAVLDFTSNPVNFASFLPDQANTLIVLETPLHVTRKHIQLPISRPQFGSS